MKFLLDFFPVVLFFVAFKMQDIFFATKVMIVASLVQPILGRLFFGSFLKMHLISSSVAIILGLATLALNDESFIKFKPTVVYWLMAAGLIFNHLFSKKTFFEYLAPDINVPEKVFRRVNLSWVMFLVFMGGLNLHVLYNYPTEVWVKFKLFGTMILSLIFVVAQTIYIMKHALNSKKSN